VESIRIRNLRSLQDTGQIDVRKLNILVGGNSSGKSTFLRVFPLLKQTFNKKINGPILWCGDDDDYVDFGSFKEAVNYTAKEKCIHLDFELWLEYLNLMHGYNFSAKKTASQKTKIEFVIKNNEDTGSDFISSMRYQVRNINIYIEFSNKNEIKKVVFNENEIPVDNEKTYYFYLGFNQGIFDISLLPLRQEAIRHLAEIFKMTDEEIHNTTKMEEGASYIVLKKIFHGKEYKKYSDKIVNEMEEIYSGENKDEIERWSFLYNFPIFFISASNYLRNYFKNVYYIAPVRATAERYYRLRNSAVDEIDCRGKNLPIFLNSLSVSDFKDFQKWTKKYLGFEVVKNISKGHVSLKVRKEGQKRAINLSDTGFGYSQILPIITQIWYISKKEYGPFINIDMMAPTTIVIEQPELHLHPALQAKLIDIIVKVAYQGDIKFIIETHSETVVNRVGNAISKKEISNQDVGVIIFEKEFGEDNTTVKKGGFDEEGYLENWPVGFFEPDKE